MTTKDERTQTAARLVLALILVGLAVWRGICVLAGPDVDTDAYAHHMIARAILADPRDLAVHWVWLPLFHYAQTPLVALGGTMNTVRWANVVLTAAVPWILFGYVRSTVRVDAPAAAWTNRDATALLAALLAAACPISMQMGTTAQPEPLFALLVLGVAITFQERRYAPAAALLGGAVMLRYEAWASLFVVAAAVALDGLRARRHAQPLALARALAVVAVPVALILAWAVLRRPVDGRWFGFLRQTREFATGATHTQTAFDGGFTGFLRDALYYPVSVPMRVFGPIALLVPFGIARTVREQGGRFVLILGACLGFISLTWVMRSSLGLDRHFVVVVPLYATFMAQGVAAIADGTAWLAGRIAADALAVRIGRWLGGTVAIAIIATLAVELEVWMGFWKGAIVQGWPDRMAMGAYLRSLPSDTTIFCDEATMEILSGLDRRRFDRHWIDDPHTWDLVTEEAQAHGVAYVATWSRKLRGHEAAGSVVFRAGEIASDPDAGLAVMRVPPDAGHAAR